MLHMFAQVFPSRTPYFICTLVAQHVAELVIGEIEVTDGLTSQPFQCIVVFVLL